MQLVFVFLSHTQVGQKLAGWLGRSVSVLDVPQAVAERRRCASVTEAPGFANLSLINRSTYTLNGFLPNEVSSPGANAACISILSQSLIAWVWDFYATRSLNWIHNCIPGPGKVNARHFHQTHFPGNYQIQGRTFLTQIYTLHLCPEKNQPSIMVSELQVASVIRGIKSAFVQTPQN